MERSPTINLGFNLANIIRGYTGKVHLRGLNKDSASDLSRNRVKLAACLKECSLELNEASIAIDKAWEICSPYCGEEIEEDSKR